jgi:predicted phage gp36 major capsid-like protein
MKSIALCAASGRCDPRARICAVAPTRRPEALIEQIQTAFAEFKKKNDERLLKAGRPRRGRDHGRAGHNDQRHDRRASAAYEDQQKKIAAAQLQPGDRKIADPEYTKRVEFVRPHGNISERVQASVDKSSSAAGGYLAPTEWDRTITDKLVKISPMRADLPSAVDQRRGLLEAVQPPRHGLGWVGDQAARRRPTRRRSARSPTRRASCTRTRPRRRACSTTRRSTSSSSSATTSPPSSLGRKARRSSRADGTNKPNGILTYVTGAANAAAHPFGAVLVRTATGTVNKLDKADDIVSFVHDLPSEKTEGAQFVMNRNTLAAVRLLKDTQNRYLWQPSYQAGQPQTLQGYPITEAADMPDIATGAIPILFGDFRRRT